MKGRLRGFILRDPRDGAAAVLAEGRRPVHGLAAPRTVPAVLDGSADVPGVVPALESALEAADRLPQGLARIGEPLWPEDEERDALTPADYAAAGVEPPDWAHDPVPSMETWRRWQAAQNAALAFKRARARNT